MKLPSIQTDHHGYALLEADNDVRWFDHLGLDASVSSNKQVIFQMLTQLLQASPVSLSGVVLDPEFGIEVLKNKPAEIGVIWQLEEPATSIDPLVPPKLSNDWTVEHIRNNLGLAKLELQYFPSEAQALVKKQLVAEIFDFCQYQEIDLLLKLVIYSPTGQPLPAPELQVAQLTAIQEFRDTCHILALQSPQDALAAATLTAELDIPWVVMSHDGQKYEVYKEQLRQALEAGARGFLVGETLWQEAYSKRRKDQGIDEAELTQFMQTTVRDRLIELHRIVGECLAS